jgi:hypothetical protein
MEFDQTAELLKVRRTDANSWERRPRRDWELLWRRGRRSHDSQRLHSESQSGNERLIFLRWQEATFLNLGNLERRSIASARRG